MALWHIVRSTWHLVAKSAETGKDIDGGLRELSAVEWEWYPARENGYAIVGAHASGDVVHFTKINILGLTKNFATLDDFERAVFERIDRRIVD
jgi:hypothetical protein